MTTLLGTDLTSRELRVVIDPRTGADSSVDALYHSALPFDRFEAAIVCPACNCNKSGSADDRNAVTEACEADCKCHYDTCPGCDDPIGDEHESEYAAHPDCCDHERVETDDVGDGVAGLGRVHEYASRCLDCGADVDPDYDAEDGRIFWLVAA
jgi:hypothetical protein